MKATWLETGETLGAAQLRDEGIHYEALPLEGFDAPLRDLMERNGYLTQDEVALRPDTPNLDAICAKFVDEHLHTDDEVRFVLEGEGVFDIRSTGDRWMHVTVEPGDLIVVPAGRNHRFYLTDAKTIRCKRLFKDQAGWVPVYRDAAE